MLVRSALYIHVVLEMLGTYTSFVVKRVSSLPPSPCSPPSVSDLIHNTDRRKEWDKQFTTIEVVEEHKNFRVMYW